MEIVTDFILGVSKITADVNAAMKLKKKERKKKKNTHTKTAYSFGRKVMNNLDIILKSRDITLPTKVLYSRLWFFSSGHVWM